MRFARTDNKDVSDGTVEESFPDNFRVDANKWYDWEV